MGSPNRNGSTGILVQNFKNGAEKDTLHAPVLTIMALAKKIAGIV